MKHWEEIRSQNYKPDGKPPSAKGAKTTRSAFKYCRKHDEVEPLESKCFLAPDPKRTSLNVPQISVFEPYYDDALSSTPTYIYSKKQKARLLKEKGLIAIG